MCVVLVALVSVMTACGSTADPSRLSPQQREALADDGSGLVPAPGAQATTGGFGGGSLDPTGFPSLPGLGGSTAPTSGPTRAPIKLGVMYAVNDGADQAGVSNGNTFTLETVVRAFVRSYNATGGIGGRRIEPVYAELHSASTNYEVGLQAACATFTEQNHVAAVVSNLGYYSESFFNCLSKASVPLISGDWAAPDRQDANRFPLLITPTTLIGDDRVAALVKHLKASGFLQARNRIGVVVEDCPVDQRVYRNRLVPALRDAGLAVALTNYPRCFQSFQTYGGQSSDLQGAVLQFSTNNIDRVIFVSQAAEANLMNLFATAADPQLYHPGYALSSIAAPAVLAMNAPAGQLANARGVGWLPSLDTQDPKQAVPTSAATGCLQRMQREGIVPATSADHAYVNGACDSFGLYDALLRATNGDASPSVILRALGTVGRTFVSASTVDGRVAVTKDGHIGAAAGRLFAWVSGRFEYTSGSFPL